MTIDLFWKFFSKMLNYLLSSDRPAICLQNIPLNTCCKTILFNYLIITIFLWRLSEFCFVVSSRPQEEPQNNKSIVPPIYTHILCEQSHITHYTQYIVFLYAHHSQPMPLTTGVWFNNVNYVIFLSNLWILQERFGYICIDFIQCWTGGNKEKSTSLFSLGRNETSLFTM